MKILTYSTLYPNGIQHRHGIFVETRLQQLIQDCEIQSIVVAPVPWFPFKSEIFGDYSQLSKIPKFEMLNNIPVYHPRFLTIPKIGMSVSPLLLFIFTYPTVKKLLRKHPDIKVIDSHYFYPDGIAAVLLGRFLKMPVTVTARGTDINLFPQYLIPGFLIKWAIRTASHVITVSEALRKKVITLGGDKSLVTTLRNGVNISLFKPAYNREELRLSLNIQGNTVLSVGNLIELKGHHLVIEAISELPDVNLIIAGDGKMEKPLKDLVRTLGVAHRVKFLGVIKQEELINYYQAADALILASSREGWANVLLESMACGTPVIATDVGGTPEVIQSPDVGVIISRNVTSIKLAIKNFFEKQQNRTSVRNYAQDFGWEPVSNGQLRIFNDL